MEDRLALRLLGHPLRSFGGLLLPTPRAAAAAARATWGESRRNSGKEAPSSPAPGAQGPPVGSPGERRRGRAPERQGQPKNGKDKIEMKRFKARSCSAERAAEQEAPQGPAAREGRGIPGGKGAADSRRDDDSTLVFPRGLTQRLLGASQSWHGGRGPWGGGCQGRRASSSR